eukprot:TRINITY_DN2802_c0_g1_i1.p1 TRINITY_DN2802_c0_g1~~TRINITY_DN2802_c0_g1_i1.p1  ORF type:complete len:220 (-),score=34.51 TRINITY_DN2802_c0_g1_i1:44-703(-)
MEGGNAGSGASTQTPSSFSEEGPDYAYVGNCKLFYEYGVKGSSYSFEIPILLLTAYTSLKAHLSPSEISGGFTTRDVLVPGSEVDVTLSSGYDPFTATVSYTRDYKYEPTQVYPYQFTFWGMGTTTRHVEVGVNVLKQMNPHWHLTGSFSSHGTQYSTTYKLQEGQEVIATLSRRNRKGSLKVSYLQKLYNDFTIIFRATIRPNVPNFFSAGVEFLLDY